MAAVAPGPVAVRRAGAQEATDVSVLLAGLRLPDSVRYSVTLVKPPERALRDLVVEVALPQEAQLVEAFETPGYTRFLGEQSGTLTWVAPEIAPGESTDALTFFLAEAPPGEFAVRARWQGERPGQARFSGSVPVGEARALTGEATLDAQGTGGAFVPLGKAGYTSLPRPGHCRTARACGCGGSARRPTRLGRRATSGGAR